MKRVNTSSAEETHLLGHKIGKHLKPNSIVLLYGDLGSGKTTLIKGIASSVTCIDPREISSPTFTYLNIYTGTSTLYHFDLYRLKQEEDFLALGFDEYFKADGICCIEWPEKISSLLSAENVIKLELSYTSPTNREIALSKDFGWLS